jgi:hypothetical protein
MSEPYLEQLYKQKYLKYKKKYLELRRLEQEQEGGGMFDKLKGNILYDFILIFTTKEFAVEKKDSDGKTILDKLQNNGLTWEELLKHFSGNAYSILENTNVFNLMVEPSKVSSTPQSESGKVASTPQSESGKASSTPLESGKVPKLVTQTYTMDAYSGNNTMNLIYNTYYSHYNESMIDGMPIIKKIYFSCVINDIASLKYNPEGLRFNYIIVIKKPSKLLIWKDPIYKLHSSELVSDEEIQTLLFSRNK